MMNQIILSSNQVHRLHHQFYEPTDDVRATLLIVHGMSEHSGRYDAFAKFLAEHGILVATYDQLGHGQTVKDKYELGFFDEKHPIQTLCKDVIIMADKLKEKSPTVPHFIMGHSMGSFIVRTVLVHHAASFDGVILMGTGNRFGLVNQLSLGTLSILNRLAPKQINQRMGYLLNQYLLNQLRSPISASPFAWLSENTDAIKAFESDPLCGFCFTNNGFVTLQALIARACQNDWYAMMDSTYPVLLVSGKDDPVGNLGSDIKQLHQALIQANIQNVRVHLYPNMRHEPLHEQDSQRVYQDILRWFNDQLSSNHSSHQP